MRETMLNYPSALLEKSVQFSDTELAWDAETADRVIEWCRDHNHLILGGDVIERISIDFLNLTYDNWYLSSLEVAENAIDSACKLAHEKVSLYTNAYNDRDILFVLVIQAEA